MRGSCRYTQTITGLSYRKGMTLIAAFYKILLAAFRLNMRPCPRMRTCERSQFGEWRLSSW